MSRSRSGTANRVLERARLLLESMRESPMRRGAISKRAIRLKDAMATTLTAQGTPAALARRIAFQLVFKFGPHELENRTVWIAVAQILNVEMAQLRDRVGLVERQIVTVLPKLSADRIEEFFEELTGADRKIARTILNAALEAAEPVPAGRRYLAEYRLVAQQLETMDPSIARTLANATFMAGAPRRKAMEFYQRFTQLMVTFEDDPNIARMFAKTLYRAPERILNQDARDRRRAEAFRQFRLR